MYLTNQIMTRRSYQPIYLWLSHSLRVKICRLYNFTGTLCQTVVTIGVAVSPVYCMSKRRHKPSACCTALSTCAVHTYGADVSVVKQPGQSQIAKEESVFDEHDTRCSADCLLTDIAHVAK